MHPSIRIPKAEFEARAQKLVEYLNTTGLSGAVLFDNYYVTYFTDFAFIPTERPMALAV
nr:aminopeptidase P family N-terminal domain-containing protein [Anaerolineales bacterium]